MKQRFLHAVFLIAVLIVSMGTSSFSQFRPAAALPLPEGRTYDQAHDTSLIDWNGPVQYVLLTHRDATALPPEEGGAACGGGCQEWVTRLSNSGTVSGAFAGNVSYFEVMVAFSHDSAVGNFVLRACSASQSASVYLGSGGGPPGFITISMTVPAGCRTWSLSAAGGYVDFRSVDANYSTIFPTNTPIPPPTFTALPTFTSTAAATRTPTATVLPASTATVTQTLTPTATWTSSPPPTATFTPTVTSSPTPSLTPTATWTITPSPTPTFTPTATPTPLPPTITSADILCDRWGENGWCVENARLSITASDPQGFPLTITGTTGQPFSCDASCIVALPEGTGTAIFTVNSTSGRSASRSLDWKYDASLPTSAVQLNGTAGANGWYVSALTVSGIGTDAVSGVGVLEVSADGGAWQPSATLSDGVYQVQSRSLDNAGWETLSTIQTVRVDTVKPGLSMIPSGTKGGGDFFRSAVTVSLAGIDAGSGVAFVEYRLDGGSWVQANILAISTDGDHGLEGRVTDNAGNLADYAIAVHIDTIPPVAVFIMPAPDSTSTTSGTALLGGHVSDVGSGVERVELSLDKGKTWQTLPLVNEIWNYNWMTLNISNGQYQVIARAWDIAGNAQSPGTSITLIVANQPPFVEVQERWFIWESGYLNVRENAGIPIDRVTVTIHDPQGRWPDLVQEYAPGRAPKTISWDRRFADGALAPSGEYEVIAQASDIFGHQASDSGTIVIPIVTSATFTATPTVTSTPSPTPTATVIPTRHIQPTQVVMATVQPTATVTPELPVSTPAGKPLSLWPVVGLIGLLMALASASLTDHRPQALRRIKQTFDQIIAQNKHGDDE